MTKKDIDNIISIICPSDEDFDKPCISPAYLKKELEALALEQEPSGDLISRQAAKRELENRFMELQKRHDDKRYETNYCLNTILELPPVNPQEKTGHWITVEMTQDDGCRYTVTYCSECDEDVDYRTDYCPNCGAKMPQEERDKE